MNYMIKDLPKNFQVFFRELNTVSIVRASMIELIKTIMFILVDILNSKNTLKSFDDLKNKQKSV